MVAVDCCDTLRMLNTTASPTPSTSSTNSVAATVQNDHFIPVPLKVTTTNSCTSGLPHPHPPPSPSSILPIYIEKEIVRTVLFDQKYTPVVWKLRLALVCRRWFNLVAEVLPQQISLKAIDLHSIREWLDQCQSRFSLWPKLDSLSLYTSPDGDSTSGPSTPTSLSYLRKYNRKLSVSGQFANTIEGGVSVGLLEVVLPTDSELKQLYSAVKSVKISVYDRSLLEKLRIDWKYFSSLSELSVYSHVSCADLISSLRQPAVLNSTIPVDGNVSCRQIKTLNLQCYGVDLNALLEIIKVRAPNLESLSFQMNEHENTIEPFLHQLSFSVSHSLVKLEVSSRSYIDFSRLTNSFPQLTRFKFNLRCKPTQQELQHQRNNQLSLFRFVDLSPNITELSIQEQTNNYNEWIDLIRRKPLITKLTLSINNNGSHSNHPHHRHSNSNEHSITQLLPTTLKHLKLFQTNTKYSINFVKLFSNLTTVSVYSLGTGCMAELSQYLAKTQILTSFKLNYWVNQHPNKQPIEFQLDPFYSAIQNNQSLRLLVIRDYEFSIQAFNRLSTALETNQTLLFVQVRFFNMTLPKSFELILSKKVKQNLEYLVRTLYRVFDNQKQSKHLK